MTVIDDDDAEDLSAIPLNERRPVGKMGAAMPTERSKDFGNAVRRLVNRVTNALDNVAQSLQQTLSQMLTSVLMLLGVATMMLTISPLLALVAFITVPVSLLVMRFITVYARPRFMAQWRNTGVLNAQ